MERKSLSNRNEMIYLTFYHPIQINNAHLNITLMPFIKTIFDDIHG